MNGSRSEDGFTILLVEDNPADARLVVESIVETGARIGLDVVEDGVEALKYLRREGSFEHARRPDLIVLDLNLPKKDGRDLLRDIMADEELRRTPVVVLTSSRAEEDVLKCYELGANCYITKPVSLERFIEVVRAIESFWLNIVTLPSERRQ
jgi:CheY-like chemotaxis protein